MTKVHVAGDRKTSWKELEIAQKEVRNHGRVLSRVFGLGRAEGKRIEQDALITLALGLWMPPY